MTLGRVVGSLVSTIKHPAYRSTKLLLVRPVDPEGKELGPVMVCMDNMGAGAGELVLVCKEGGAVRQVLGLDHCPIRSIILAVVDRVDFEGNIALTE